MIITNCQRPSRDVVLWEVTDKIKYDDGPQLTRWFDNLLMDWYTPLLVIRFDMELKREHLGLLIDSSRRFRIRGKMRLVVNKPTIQRLARCRLDQDDGPFGCPHEDIDSAVRDLLSRVEQRL